MRPRKSEAGAESQNGSNDGMDEAGPPEKFQDFSSTRKEHFLLAELPSAPQIACPTLTRTRTCLCSPPPRIRASCVQTSEQRA